MAYLIIYCSFVWIPDVGQTVIEYLSACQPIKKHTIVYPRDDARQDR